MKKIFFIVACCLTVFIIGLLISTNFIFITQKVTSKTPNTINIYNKSIASLNGKSYTSEDAEFVSIINNVENLGKISLFERLINGLNLDTKITQSKDKEYTSTIADVKNTNVCVEFIYEAKQDKIVYINDESKVISFNKLIFVLPTDKVGKVVVYYAEGNNGYDNYDPLIMNGKAENLINHINNL